MFFRKKASAIVLLAISLSLTISPAQAQEKLYKTVIHNAISKAILPGYTRLQNASRLQVSSLKSLCTQKTIANLETAQSDFKSLLIAWSKVELYRFGPARVDNRQEKLFFWPDRRSRGLKQIKSILLQEDNQVLIPENLIGKSVAVQGLTALEYVLFGKGAKTLSKSESSPYRCSYGLAIAKVIEQNATFLKDGWQENARYPSILSNPGPANPIYKSAKEVIRDLLQYSNEILQIVEMRKIQPMLKKGFDSAAHKPAPFWRSNMTIQTLVANLQSVAELQTLSDMQVLLPKDEKGQVSSLHFEISQALKMLKVIKQYGTLSHILQNREAYEKLVYLKNPIGGAQNILSEYYPEALGITMGFNSLDGD
ncbi:imelysin family protein [Sneathiella aquimaris]|uniref:imelysin family protein n=1 Tax=Sneathiella aquimaris TaxID=2599305 RepID=UPI00146A5D43|nr:imelysin family protein [Sneathiella aquimaris]